jgi:NADH-quinone oxidoreductase subunit E
MVMLAIETLLLMAAAVAVGFFLGVVGKQMFGTVIPLDGGPRLTEIIDLVDAVEAVRRPRPASGAPVEVASEPARNDETDAASIDEVVAEVSAAADAVAPDLERAEAADRVGRRPPMLASPREGIADDLRRIKGIGPQNEARLNALGVYHHAQIAAWTPEEARWVGAYLAFAGRIEREDWVGQARALVAQSGTA